MDEDADMTEKLECYFFCWQPSLSAESVLQIVIRLVHDILLV